MVDECNVDDILCQIEVLRSMRALQTALGDETFTEEFPELAGLDAKLIDKINAQRGDIREALAECGNIDMEIDEE